MNRASYARSRSLDALVASLDQIVVEIGDYFDDELTGQLNITKSWLQEALATIRQQELQRLGLVHLISGRAAREARIQRDRNGRLLNHASAD